MWYRRSCDNWNFNASNPCVYVGGNYNQNANYGLFYLNYNSTSNTNGNIGSRILYVWLTQSSSQGSREIVDFVGKRRRKGMKWSFRR